MKKKNALTLGSKIFIGFSAFSLAYVSLLSMFSPQSTMDLVQVQLPNNDAVSSIRGIYGGVGLTIVTSLIYLMVKNYMDGLRFLVMFWALYAVSRMITIGSHGPLGDFGNQWLVIETFLFITGAVLLYMNKRRAHATA